MAIFDRQEFEEFLLSHRSVEIVHQWGDASVGKIGGKIFAILSVWSNDGTNIISFKCSDLSFTILPELNGVEKAKYLARAKWVQVPPISDLSEADIKAYITEAYRMISDKLPKRVKAALDLT